MIWSKKESEKKIVITGMKVGREEGEIKWKEEKKRDNIFWSKKEREKRWSCLTRRWEGKREKQNEKEEKER